MLKGISPILTPELLKIIAEMGHGDELVLADGNFPAASIGKRCVRIVHGRGHGSPGREGVLRQLVKGWLARRRDVLAFCHAPSCDGGQGALWVLLKSSEQKR